MSEHMYIFHLKKQTVQIKIWFPQFSDCISQASNGHVSADLESIGFSQSAILT